MLCHDDEPIQRLAKILEPQRTPLLDLGPAFARESGEDGYRLIVRGDGHWNALGHRLAAESVAVALENHICSATQDRQDAVEELCREGVDLMIVIGGYNSSNTNHLTEIASDWTRAYHIEDVSCLVDAKCIRHKPRRHREEIEETGWLSGGPLAVGITAGASTPNSRVGEVVEKILTLRGVSVRQLLEQTSGD